MDANKSALEEYQELEQKVKSFGVVLTKTEVASEDPLDPDRIRLYCDIVDKVAWETYWRMQELLPLVQQECRQSQIDHAKDISHPDDQQRAIELLKELVRKWKLLGNEALVVWELEALLVGNKIDPAICGRSSSTSGKDNEASKVIGKELGLLNRLKLMAGSEEEQNAWNYIENALTNALMDGVIRPADKKEAIAKAAETIDKHLGEISRIFGVPPGEPDPFEVHCRLMPLGPKCTHRDRARAFKLNHPKETRNVNQLMKRSEYLESKEKKAKKLIGSSTKKPTKPHKT